MPIVERKKVVEHRVSKRLRNRFDELFVIRLWVESDPAFGGTKDRSAAIAELESAVNAYRQKPEWNGLTFDTACDKLADFLFDACTSASSIEVCDKDGNGVTLHRDWP